MKRLDQYIEAAERDNTRLSYASAIRPCPLELAVLQQVDQWH